MAVLWIVVLDEAPVDSRVVGHRHTHTHTALLPLSTDYHACQDRSLV